MKKEKLEEAAESFWLNDNSMSDYVRLAYVTGFIAGAKWQQERSYSEEEVRQLFQKYISTQIPLSRLRVILHKDFKDWFEQFKNK